MMLLQLQLYTFFTAAAADDDDDDDVGVADTVIDNNAHTSVLTLLIDFLFLFAFHLVSLPSDALTRFARFYSISFQKLMHACCC